MAKIIPFKGILYNPEKVDVSLTTAPPYDVITPKFKEELYEKDPRNIIRIDFGKDSDDDSEDENRYTRAARHLSDWLQEGTLIHDPEPAFYCYEISYEINGKFKKTRGFLGAVKIEDFGVGKIHPHEMTYSKPKSDRLNILRYCNANTSPIFSLYSSREKITSAVLGDIVKETPVIEAENGDGFIHRLWRISDSASIKKIIKEMSDRDVFIADGHHRYETSLAFRKEMEGKGLSKTGEEPFNYVLMFLSNMEDEGLSLLPTHRIVEIDSDIHIKETLEKYFYLKKISSEVLSEEQARRQMFQAIEGNLHSFGMFLTNTGSYYTLSIKNSDIEIDLPDCLKTIDVSVLHNFVFEKLLKVKHYEYEMDPGISVHRAKKGSFEAVFFLNPTKIHDLREVALAGHRMPPKSTYFYPKLLTGMVIYKF
ncbi:MAG: DUF1015 domain-containing protein [Nitrospirae bacterium]|nr:DUF1015 domain-containing protein [Nitrospirota bacterium]